MEQVKSDSTVQFISLLSAHDQGEEYAEYWTLYFNTFYFAQKAKSMGNNIALGSTSLRGMTGATK